MKGATRQKANPGNTINPWHMLPKYVTHECVPVLEKKVPPPNNGSSDVSIGGILQIAHRLEGKGSQSMIKTNPSVSNS